MHFKIKFLQVLFKLDLQGNCQLIKKEDLNKFLSFENYSLTILDSCAF